MTLTEAKRKANKKWDEKNKERKSFISRRSTARNFVKKWAQEEDLKELEELIKLRRKELENK